jgi:hypothetical protein
VARWVLNTFSTVELVVIGVGGSVLLTIACVLVARRRFPQLADSEFEPVADSLRVVYELIFALILAFVIAAVLDEMGNAESAVASEATSIAELVRANDALPPSVGVKLDAAVDRYVHAVAIDEWKTMKEGNQSPQATSEIEGMYAAYETVPKAAAENAFYGKALDDLHEVASKRRDRLNIASSDLPTMLRVLVVVGLVLLLVLEYRPHLKPVAGLAFMGTLAMVVTSAFLLTVILNYPFAGDVSVSNAPFKQGILARFWSEELAFKPKPGDKVQPLTVSRLQGVFNSTAYGTLILRCYDDNPLHTVRACAPGDTRMRGVYRSHRGTITGQVTAGVFTGWWSEAPGHRMPGYAGRVKLRLWDTSDGPLIAGDWSDGYGAFHHGWDLKPIGGGPPPDLVQRLHDPRSFIEAPHVG